jgi:EpsI family protein
MPESTTASPFGFLRGTPVLVVTVLLVVETAVFYALPTKEYIPTPPPLDQFAATVGPWQMIRQYPMDDYTQSFLKADDTLSRQYTGPAEVEFFVAFFKSQRAGVTPHSPKVCLPGTGWTPESSRIISVNVPGEAAPIPVNRYVVTHEESRNLVLYWYQNQHRVTASEYLSKFYLIFDALRYHRSDEALVRVITPLLPAAEARAEERAIEFIRDVYLPLKQQMWAGGDSAGVRPPPLPRYTRP